MCHDATFLADFPKTKEKSSSLLFDDTIRLSDISKFALG